MLARPWVGEGGVLDAWISSGAAEVMRGGRVAYLPIYRCATLRVPAGFLNLAFSAVQLEVFDLSFTGEMGFLMISSSYCLPRLMILRQVVVCHVVSACMLWED